MIVIAGATGNLGGKITDALLQRGAVINAIIRNETDDQKFISLNTKTMSVVTIHIQTTAEIATPC